MASKNRSIASVCAATLLASCGVAHGQFTSSFETPTYTGSAAGTVITGQDGWYLPGVANSVDGAVFTYAGNAIGVAANPFGELQMQGGTPAVAGTLVRAQHAVNFSAGGMWSACWDCTARWNGTLPAVNNIGSWSMQDSATSRYFQQLMSWGGAGNAYTVPPPDNTATGDKFHIHIGHFTVATPATITFSSPAPEWIDIPVNNWMRVGLTWDFTTAKVLSVSLRNLTAGTPTVTTDVSGLDWLLQGGPTGTNPLPTDIRLFVGGATMGNVAAYDNVKIGPGPSQCPAATSTCYVNCDNSTIAPCLNVNDFTCFLNQYSANNVPYANCDSSTIAPVLNVNDFTCFLNRFGAGCTGPCDPHP